MKIVTVEDTKGHLVAKSNGLSASSLIHLVELLLPSVLTPTYFFFPLCLSDYSFSVLSLEHSLCFFMLLSCLCHLFPIIQFMHFPSLPHLIWVCPGHWIYGSLPFSTLSFCPPGWLYVLWRHQMSPKNRFLNMYTSSIELPLPRIYLDISQSVQIYHVQICKVLISSPTL